MKHLHPKSRGIVAMRAETPDAIAVFAELRASFEGWNAKNQTRFQEINDRLDEANRSVAALTVGGVGPGKPSDDQYLAHARAFFANVQRRPFDDATVDLDALKDYEAAFTHYVRRGPDAMGNSFKAAMSVGSDPDGGYWAPPAMSRQILMRMFETSPMRRIATVTTLGAGSIELPIDTNDATSGGWVGETEARPETATPEVGMQEIFAREQYAMPIVTQKLLDDGAIDIEMWLSNKIADKLRRTENTAFVTGAGVGQPRGFLDYGSAAVTTDDATRAWGVLQYVPTGSAGGFPTISGGGAAGASDADSLIDLQMKLKPDYLANAVWTMRRSTAAVIRKMKDADGRYLWVDSLAVGQPPALLGHPVVFLEDMPAINSDTFSVAFGDFRAGYEIFDRIGIRVLRDPYTTKGKVKLYTTKRVGADCRDFDAIKLLKFSAS